MKLHYEALGKGGEFLTGEIEATNEREAMRLLSADGLTVTEVKTPPEPGKPLFQRKLKLQEKVIALFELATLLESGVSIAEAIESQAQSEYHPKLNIFFDSLSQGLRKGESLSTAIEATSLELPEYFVKLVKAGELSGRLPQCLRKGVEQMEYELDMSNQLRSALVYPAVLVFSGIAAVLLIFVFVVPKFENLLTDSADLPSLAWLVLTTGMWFNDYFYIIGFLFAGGIVMLLSVLRKPAVQSALRNNTAKIPIVGAWLNESEIARWSSVMAAMLESRVELVASLDMAQKSVRLDHYRQRLDQVKKAVRAGESLSKALSDNRVLLPIAYNLIRVGEKSGNLAKMLGSVAQVYDTSCKNRMKTVIAIIEPAAILVIGVVIGVLVLGIILAITSVNTVSI